MHRSFNQPQEIQILVVQSQKSDALKTAYVPSEQELQFVVRAESLPELFSPRFLSKSNLNSGLPSSPRTIYVRIRLWQRLLRQVPTEFKLALQHVKNPNELLFLGSSIPRYILQYLGKRYPDAFTCQVSNTGTISRGLILLQEGSVSPVHALQQLQAWRAKHQF